MNIFQKNRQPSRDFSILISGLAFLTITLVTGGYPGIVHAELSLPDALRIAVQQHPSVASRRSEVEAARQGLEGAQWQRFPSAAVSTSSAENGDSIATARIQQPLWTGGRITAEIDGATARVVSAEEQLAEAERAIMVKTSSAYAELLRARGRIEIAEKNVAEHNRLYQMIRRRVASEVSTGADETLALARLQQAITEKIQFEAQSANAAAVLGQIIGRRVVAADVRAAAGPRKLHANLADALRVAEDSSPQLRRLDAEKAVVESEIKSRKSALWPQISARAERITGGNFADRNRATLVLEFQPGAGLSAMSAISAARARLDAAQANRDSARQDLADQLRTDWNEILSLSGQIRPLTELQKATSEVVDSFLRQYAVGRKTWIDVLNAQRESAQAGYALTDAQSSLLLANVRLALLTGVITPENTGGNR